MSNSKGRGAHKRKENVKIADEFKNICPKHRLKDLDALVKQVNGDRDKMQETIEQWWDLDPPVQEEEKWEDVGRKSKQTRGGNQGNGSSGKRGDYRGGGRGGYSRSAGGGGRGGHGRGMAGGRGAGHDRRGRGRDSDNGKGGRYRSGADQDGPVAQKPVEKKEAIPGPAPVKNERPLQGAWGQRAAPAAPPAAPVAPAAPVPEPEPTPVVPPEEEDIAESIVVVVEEDPTPADFVENTEPIQPVAPAAPKPVPAPPTGNVWATRGSAHLIQKEKPIIEPNEGLQNERKNTRKQPKEEEPLMVEEPMPAEVPPSPVVENIITESASAIEELIADPASQDALNDGLSASVNGANINAAGWKPLSESNAEMQPSPVGPVSVASAPSVGDAPLMLGNEDVPVPPKEAIVEEEPVAPVAASIVEPLKQTNVLNMGQWETGEEEEAQNMNFGFGSYGAENDVASVEETPLGSTTTNVTTSIQTNTSTLVPPPSSEPVAAANSTISPARPPPGLGLGMPPMPDKIVSVHELETKLENAAIAPTQEEPKDKPMETNLTDKLPDKPVATQTNATPATNQPNNENFMVPPGVMPQGGYNMGMYNYNGQNAVTGFMGVPTPAGPPVLSGGVLPQQPKQQNTTVPQNSTPPLSQGGLYGAPAAAPAGPESNSTSESNTQNPANGGIPPPGMMPYNPAVFYGQQPYQMATQPHGVGYGYGYGQFGNVQGAGFGYQQQVMGQGGGYGQQPYEEQTQHHGSHNGNNHQNGGYNKNGGGGYRGRNNHHNNHHNQYQNQYNPQGHGGYGGQPYNMGYNEHFNQRGGYGPATMDPYMQNSGYQSGFSNQDDDQQLGKSKNKGNNRGNNNFGSNSTMNQYQQAPQSGSQSQQQHFGSLQGTSGATDNGNNGGLPYQGGWGNSGL